MAESHLQEQIEMISRHEQEFLEKRTRAQRLGDAIGSFVGSLGSVVLHLAIFAFWMIWNVSRRTVHFDPAPFALLGTLVAMEAIILASFILMRQARMNRRADERDHLMLQVLLLTEKEITAVLKMDRKIAQHVGLDQVANSSELKEMSRDTSIDEVAEIIRESMPES